MHRKWFRLIMGFQLESLNWKTQIVLDFLCVAVASFLCFASACKITANPWKNAVANRNNRFKWNVKRSIFGIKTKTVCKLFTICCMQRLILTPMVWPRSSWKWKFVLMMISSGERYISRVNINCQITNEIWANAIIIVKLTLTALR